jgi:hypothetical protein
VNSPTRSPDNRPGPGQGNSRPDGSLLNLVRRILRREDSTGLTGADSLKPAVSLRSSVIRRLEGLLTKGVPTSMGVLPIEGQASPTPARGEEAEKPGDSAAEPESTASKDSLGMPSEFMAMVRRLEGCFTQDLPTSTEAPIEAQESSTPGRGEVTEKSRDSASEPTTTVPKVGLDMPSEFMVMVRRLEGCSQNLPTNRELLPIEVQESSTSEHGEAAEEAGDSAAKPKTEPRDNVSMPSKFMAVRSARLAAKGAIARSQPVYREIETNLKNHTEEFERRQAPLPPAVESVSASLQQLQANADAAVATLSRKLDSEKQRFVAETQQQFEKLCASGRAFVDDTQKQLAATVQSSLDSLINAAIEKTRAELDASKQSLIEESQKQLASRSRASLEPLTKDLIEQVRAELTASRPVFIEDTQNQLAKLRQCSVLWLQSVVSASVKQVSADLMDAHKAFTDEAQKQLAGMTQASLEPLVKTTVEQGRKELSLMVNEFLANRIPQIEADLRTLVNRHSDGVQAQATGASTDTLRSAALHPVPSPGRGLEFTLAESVPPRRVDLRDVWAELASGLKIGVALGLMVLVMFAIYASSSPVVRLRTKPPAAFFEESPSWNAKQRAREDELARAYWDIAVRDIETKYGFGTTLPTDPPDSFEVEEKGALGTTPRVDSAARARYWEKLRDVWPRSDSWERTSDWNLHWIGSH